MKRVVLLLICILLLILDNTVMPFFSVKGITPSLLFTFAILFSLINGYWEAIIIGAFSGVLQDVYSMYPFGINSLLNLIVCLIAAGIGENIFKHKRLIPLVTTLGLTILKYLGLFLIGKLIHMIIPVRGFFILGIYNTILAFFLYGFVYNLSNKKLMKQQWKFSEK
ncbi:rod shape-determining protein MreD [Clostridium tarantellae]|uniref:Rod shape-determining protein MreD n=1 Tax=Clostridium tarantellae TaxID=39493 RepID=A0A6I1MGJ5_9CLOT|nr:rod shape-determining protein MreD [Clostridium tarantellae]MPQ42495.1 rod shape-determining protein MreD [Clostridium tarantellae]